MNRRTFNEYCARAAVHAVVFRHLPWWASGAKHVPVLPRTGWHASDPPDAAVMLALAQWAIDSAISAGAAYADARLTHTLDEFCQGSVQSPPSLAHAVINKGKPTLGSVTLQMGIGVRAFVHGYWGFASSPYWTPADAIRLGQEAAGQAQRNAAGSAPRAADLGTTPVVRNGRWVQPGIDPFTISIDEKIDVLQAIAELAVHAFPVAGASMQVGVSDLSVWREERVFASSEGASYAQVRYRTRLEKIQVEHGSGFGGLLAHGGSAVRNASALYARGWESIDEMKLDEVVPQLVAQSIQTSDEIAPAPGIKPCEVGRYDVVFNAASVGALMFDTLGAATELDRALGYEADAAGTSYLGPNPRQYLGTPVAASCVTLTANRTQPGALATVHWDDEGIAAQEFSLIRDGVLVDYQTTREQARWLAPWYTSRGGSLQSHGCSTAATALDNPIQMTPNLVLSPGHEAIDVAELIKDTAQGIFIPECVGIDVDQQCLDGGMQTTAYQTGMDWRVCPREIRNGRLGPVLTGVKVLINASELWKNVIALGSSASMISIVQARAKGQPSQSTPCNVTAVPIKVHNLTITSGY